MVHEGTRSECHIIPFYMRPSRCVKVEHSDLGMEATTIRGLYCTRKMLDGSVPVHKSGRRIENVFYWVPKGESNTTFERGVEMVRNGLGYPSSGGQSMLYMLSKKRRTEVLR
jgi:hypothetical protein